MSDLSGRSAARTAVSRRLLAFVARADFARFVDERFDSLVQATDRLTIRLVSNEDIFLFKLAAGRDDDIEDMNLLVQAGLDYDVEMWEELEQSLAADDLTSTEFRDHSNVITRWEVNLEDRRIIKHALALYSDVEAAREQMIDVGDCGIG